MLTIADANARRRSADIRAAFEWWLAILVREA